MNSTFEVEVEYNEQKFVLSGSAWVDNNMFNDEQDSLYYTVDKVEVNGKDVPMEVFKAVGFFWEKNANIHDTIIDAIYYENDIY